MHHIAGESTGPRRLPQGTSNYAIVSIGDADGNNTSVVTFFIRYKKPNDTREYWSDWAYETKDRKYVLVGKGTENVFSGAQVSKEGHVGVI